MLFYEDDPKPLLPTVPPSIISSTKWLSEGPADVCNLWDAGKLVKRLERQLRNMNKKHWTGIAFHQILFCEIQQQWL